MASGLGIARGRTRPDWRQREWQPDQRERVQARAFRVPGAGVVGCLCVALLPRYGPHAGTLAAFAFLRLLSPTVILASLALPATPSPF